jgi:ubiquitin carboxyl-terminal hydrolase 8
MESENPKKGQIGLGNLGNTCYLNSILQCLRHVADLTVFFHKHSDSWIHEGDAKDAALCRAYKELTEGLWSGNPPGYMRPAGFLQIFRRALHGTMFEHMIAPQQHDGHEALMFLLDQLHEGMRRPLNINVMADPSSPVYGALTAWKEKVAPQYSPMVDYFFGLMEVAVTCKGCGNVSCRYEPFNMLNVDFPNPKEVTLDECMDFTFAEEPIDEYQCEKCSPDLPKDAPPGSPKPKRHPGIIQRRIWRLPQNLIVVVKRFRFDGRGQSKCHANFKAETTQKFEKWFAPASPEASHHASYTLQSTVDHHGSSNGGHYTAQIKSPITGLWNVYDDESVNQLTDGSKAHLGAMTYILFYRKSG